MPQLVGVEHRADRLDLPVKDVERQGLDDFAVPVDGDAADSLLKLIDALEDNDDVQIVSANFEMSDDTLAKLTA